MTDEEFKEWKAGMKKEIYTKWVNGLLNNGEFNQQLQALEIL